MTTHSKNHPTGSKLASSPATVGLRDVVALDSSICLIENDMLYYRGINIDELALHATFEEVVFLLWHGRLPKRPELIELTESIATVEAAFDATNGAQTPFGHRWGGDVFPLSHSHIETIQQGQTLALDVMGEYVVFLKSVERWRE